MIDLFERGKHVGTQCDACGGCCCTIMFPKEWYEIHRFQAVLPVIYTHRTESITIPFTESGRCCFQLPDGKCAVHDTKADICKNWNCDGKKQFGKDMHSWLTTHFRSPNGRLWVLRYQLEAIEEE